MRRIYTAISFIVPLIVYVLTLLPGLTFIDSDELAAVAATLGVAHPTGYPLFTLIGNLFSHLPFGEEIYNMNLMSAVIASATIAVLFNFMYFLLSTLSENNTNSKGKLEKSDETLLYNISLAASFLLAFCFTFWDSANQLEVYALHCLIIISLMYLFCVVAFSEIDSILKGKYFLLFTYIAGLGFSHHLSLSFMMPGLLYLAYVYLPIKKSILPKIALLAFLFILGLTPYFYLLIRGDNSVLHWGDTGDFASWFRHISGSDFGDRMFAATENSAAQFKRFFKRFPSELGYVHLLFIPFGIMYLYKNSRTFLIYLAISFVTCVALAINYSILDIFNYFLLAIIVSVVISGFGLKHLIDKTGGNKAVLGYVAVLLSLSPLVVNYTKADRSKETIAQDFAVSALRSAPQNSIILTTFLPSFYLQFVESYRPDVTVINGELFTNDWYINHIKEFDKELYENSRNEFDEYLKMMIDLRFNKESYTNPKTENERRNIGKLQTSFDNLMRSIVNANYGKRDFLTTYDIDDGNALTLQNNFTKDFYRLPQGLLLKYTKDSAFTDFDITDFEFDPYPSEDFNVQFVTNVYFKAFYNQAEYFYTHGKKEKAEMYIRKAIKVNPADAKANGLLAKIQKM